MSAPTSLDQRQGRLGLAGQRAEFAEQSVGLGACGNAVSASMLGCASARADGRGVVGLRRPTGRQRRDPRELLEPDLVFPG